MMIRISPITISTPATIESPNRRGIFGRPKRSEVPTEASRPR